MRRINSFRIVALTAARSSAERAAFVFAGTGLADVVLASLVFGRAVERDIGRILPL